MEDTLEGLTIGCDDFWIGPWSRGAKHVVLSEAVELDTVGASIFELHFTDTFVASFTVGFSLHSIKFAEWGIHIRSLVSKHWGNEPVETFLWSKGKLPQLFLLQSKYLLTEVEAVKDRPKRDPLEREGVG